MASVPKVAAVPATVVAYAHNSDGTEVRISGAGPYTLTDAQAAVIKQAKVMISGVPTSVI